MAENNNSNRVTNKQIADAIQSLTIRVEVMSAKLDNEITKTEKVITDHETRIRRIEESFWKTAWVPSIITAVLTTTIGGIIVAFANNII